MKLELTLQQITRSMKITTSPLLLLLILFLIPNLRVCSTLINS